MAGHALAGGGIYALPADCRGATMCSHRTAGAGVAE